MNLALTMMDLEIKWFQAETQQDQIISVRYFFQDVLKIVIMQLFPI